MVTPGPLMLPVPLRELALQEVKEWRRDPAEAYPLTELLGVDTSGL